EKLAKAEVPKATALLIPRKVADSLGACAVKFDGERHSLSVVTSDPDNADLISELKIVSGAREIKAFVARPAAVAAFIQKSHGGDNRGFVALEQSRVSGQK